MGPMGSVGVTVGDCVELMEDLTYGSTTIDSLPLDL